MEDVSEQLEAPFPEFADQTDCSQVLLALARVDQVYQAAVALFYLEDYSYKDIAEILEVPVGTIKSRIARGIEQLREILLTDGSAVLSRRKKAISVAEKSPTPPKDLPLIDTLPCGIKNR